MKFLYLSVATLALAIPSQTAATPHQLSPQEMSPVKNKAYTAAIHQTAVVEKITYNIVRSSDGTVLFTSVSEQNGFIKKPVLSTPLK